MYIHCTLCTSKQFQLLDLTRVVRNGGRKVVWEMILVCAPDDNTKFFAGTFQFRQCKRKSQLVVGWKFARWIFQCQRNGFGTIAAFVVAIEIIGIARRNETGDPRFVDLIFYGPGIDLFFGHTFDSDCGGFKKKEKGKTWRGKKE